MSEPRAYTPDELRDHMLEQIVAYSRYWAELPDTDRATGRTKSIADRCEGVAFSILAMLDGDSMLPGVNLVFQPHEDDKEYHISQGENWIEPGTTVSDTLHEHFHRFSSIEPPAPPNLRDTILELAAKDRETTLHNVFAALEELQAIRPAVAGITYDPMLIGAHAEAKTKLGAALMGMLTESGAIEYAQVRTISGGAAMEATLMVVLPVGVTVEPADQEVTKN